MSVPHRQLFRVVPSKGLMVSADRSGIVSGFQLLHPGIPYMMTALYKERLQEEDPKLLAEPVAERPLHDDCTSLLVFFPGGIGDVIALKPVLQEFKYQRPDVDVAVVSTLRDKCLIGDVVTLYDYPVAETIADQYDAWINIAEMDRASIGQALPVTFAAYLDVEVPKWPPMLDVDFGMVRAMQGFIRDPERPRIGVHLASASHFRSIPNFLGGIVKMGLVERGCDVYELGGPSDQFPWRHEDAFSGPPEHIYDMVPHVASLESYMAFLEHVDVLLTCDTGAMHIVGALGVPTISLFGMTDGSNRTAPYHSVEYIQSDRECSPCNRVAEDVPCNEPYCLGIAEMNPEMIVEKVIERYYRETDACEG